VDGLRRTPPHCLPPLCSKPSSFSPPFPPHQNRTPKCAILPPLPDTSPHSLGGRVPGLICIDDHLAEGDVVSPQATGAGVREKTSIPQNSIHPLDSIIAPPFSGIFLILESVHPDNDVVVSRAAAGGRRRRWCQIDVSRWLWRGRRAALRGGWLMGSRGSDCAKGVVSGRWVAAGEGVEVSGGGCYGVFLLRASEFLVVS
jgi:hypothetical protein